VDDKIKILFLAAGADDEGRRRSQQEAREISRRLQSSKEGDSFELIAAWAVQTSDLQKHLLEHRPHVVHLSAQATEAGEILLSDDRDTTAP
jgi:hypothetical protein